jgi:hypothetical protein
MDNIRRASDKAKEVKSALTIKDSFMSSMVTYIIILFIVYQLIDLLMVYVNHKLLDSINDGKANCSDNWMTLPLGIFTNYTIPENACPETNSSSCDNEVKDALSGNVVGGYNTTELLSYVIIPALTLLGIGYALIFTRPSYADFIFWTLIATLVYTAVVSLTYTTNIDILPPDQPSPLTYITEKLNMKQSDELEYTFLSRKSNGETCTIQGVMLGGGVHSPNSPGSVEGTNQTICNKQNLNLE